MSSRRIAFLDVDGTLIDHDQRLAPSAVAAVRGARAAGHLVYICTGRSRAEISPEVLDIGFDGVISAGGGFIERDGELLAAHTMPEDAVRELIAFFAQNDVEYTLQGYEGVYPSEGVLSRLAPMFTARGWDIADASSDMIRLADKFAYRGAVPLEGIAKATFFGDSDRTFATVRDGLGDRFHVVTGTIPYLGHAGGEVSLRGMNKGAALVELVGVVGLTAADAIAIGDGSNDLEMLQVAGVGIAMGNADDVVKAHADETTTSVHDDGVWTAFVRHGLVQSA
ncbi:Cof-type HAD-IIB family hydrolase [Microbacterium sp. P01]|uniref:Cof-type HAD-IIB family hydrolase n=1 Tax=Microbacterium sp. P01 TaxID=3366261 RepID=UPI00366E299A